MNNNNTRYVVYTQHIIQPSRLKETFFFFSSLLQVNSKLYDSKTRSVKLIELYPNTRYLICVIGLSNWQSNSVNKSAAATSSATAASVANVDSTELSNNHVSRCTEVRTLDAGEDYQVQSPQESSILTRRLGLIIGSCMGFVVFVILVIVLAYMKVKKQRENAKNEQPLPPEYLSYRHFSLHGCDPLSMHAQRTTTLNL